MTFRFEHHKKILTVLKCLDSDILRKSSAYFGGGTLLTFEFEEYRWSNDVDFIAREKCFLSLQVDQAQIPKIIDGIDLLSTDLGLSHTPRVFREQHDIFVDLETQIETKIEKREDS